MKSCQNDFYPCLLIQFEELNDPKNQPKYTTKAWLFYDKEKRIILHNTERVLDKKFYRNELNDVVEVFWSSAQEKLLALTEPTQLHIEFLLPDSLLSVCFDQYQDKSEICIGIDNTVVVRSLRRLNDHLPKSRLQQQHSIINKLTFSHLIEDFPSTNNTTICLSCDRDIDASSLRAGLKSVGCVVLDKNGPEKLTDKLTKLIDCGVPVILWSRKPSFEATNHLKELLNGQTLYSLPDKIKEERVSAYKANNPEHGKHITLLWDHLERIPPKPRQKTNPT